MAVVNNHPVRQAPYQSEYIKYIPYGRMYLVNSETVDLLSLKRSTNQWLDTNNIVHIYDLNLESENKNRIEIPQNIEQCVKICWNRKSPTATMTFPSDFYNIDVLSKHKEKEGLLFQIFTSLRHNMCLAYFPKVKFGYIFLDFKFNLVEAYIYRSEKIDYRFYSLTLIQNEE